LINNIEEKKDYRIVQRGNIKKTSSPIECPLCLCVAIDEIDVISILRSSCCFDCENEVVDPHREEWLAGWKPTKKELLAIRSRRLASAHSRKHI
jgi:hypothetical protein